MIVCPPVKRLSRYFVKVNVGWVVGLFHSHPHSIRVCCRDKSKASRAKSKFINWFAPHGCLVLQVPELQFPRRLPRMEGFHRVLGGLSFLVLKYLRTTNLKCSHDEEQRLEKVILCTRNFRPDLGRLAHERIHGQLYTAVLFLTRFMMSASTSLKHVSRNVRAGST